MQSSYYGCCHRILDADNGRGELYLGSCDFAFDLKQLQQFNIKAILSVFSEYKIKQYSDIDLLQIDLHDFHLAKISNYFDKAYEYINSHLEKGQNVFVHCMAGISRSPTIVISYLMKHNQWGFEKAFEFVKERRQIISPNCGFLEQLKKYDKELQIIQQSRQLQKQQ